MRLFFVIVKKIIKKHKGVGTDFQLDVLNYAYAENNGKPVSRRYWVPVELFNM